MKKMIAMLTTAALAVCLAACGSSVSQADKNENKGQGAESPQAREDAADSVEISLWVYPVGSWENSSTLARLLSGFKKRYPDIHVSVKHLDYADGDKEVEAAIEAGKAPDLIFEGPERLVANWGSRGLMADLSDLWTEDATEGIFDAVRDACQGRNGEYYEFPICMTTHCMAVNRDMFQAADALKYLDEENHTWTTDGFIQAVQALRAYGQKKVGVVYCGDQGGDQGTRALVNNLYGGSFTNESHTEYTLSGKENIRALKLLRDMDGIRFDPTIVGGDEAGQFCKGELAMAFCWNVAIEVSHTVKNPDLDFDVLPMAFPTSSGEPRLQGGIWGFGIFDNGDQDRIDAAKTFIDFMTGDDRQYEKAVLASSYWPVRELDGLYANDELMTEYGIFKQYLGDYYQVASGWPQARTAWWKMLQQVGDGEDIAAAVEEFDRAANAAVEGD